MLIDGQEHWQSSQWHGDCHGSWGPSGTHSPATVKEHPCTPDMHLHGTCTGGCQGALLVGHCHLLGDTKSGLDFYTSV